jgi:hypothetical protein
MAETTLDTVADDGIADRSADHEADECRALVVVGEQVRHERALPMTTS